MPPLFAALNQVDLLRAVIDGRMNCGWFSRMKNPALGVGLFCVLFIFRALPVHADTAVTITATVENNGPLSNPIVEFRGFAAPSATIILRRDGTDVATATADTQAAFALQLPEQPVGQVVYQIVAQDVSGHALAPLTFALNLTLGTNTIITGVFLGPSIAINTASVKLGQFVTLSGDTAPDSAVTVVVHSVQALSFTISADANGYWSKIVNTQEVGVGTHTAYAQSVLGGNQVSAASSTISFAVNPLEQCDGKRTADLNCDGKVDLTDFSILLYFWNQTTPSNGRADINSDSRVDIIDFSIMLYQWTA